MKNLTRCLAVSLVLSLAFHPSFAHAGAVVSQAAIQGSGAQGAMAAGAVTTAGIAPAALNLNLTHLSLGPSLVRPGSPGLRTPSIGALRSGVMTAPAAAPKASPSLAVPAVSRGAAPAVVKTVAAKTAQAPSLRTAPNADVRAIPSAVATQAGRAKPSAPRASAMKRVRSIFTSVSRQKPTLSRMAADGAYGAARTQMDWLTGGKSVAGSASAAPVSGKVSAARVALSRPSAAAADKAAAKPYVPAVSENPAPKSFFGKIRDFFGGRIKVFRDPERNKAFWRYFLGQQFYMFGFQMYIVALPYLMKAFTRNTLEENGKLDGVSPEALTAMVRQNRSNARIAHWVSQAVSYAAIPLFTKDGKAGPGKWLVRTALIRSAVIFGIPAVFFASGVFSAQTALLVLLGLIGLQSFFQGIYVTMSSGSTARIMGDKSVTSSERLKANAILSFSASIIAILAPAIAGKIAVINDLFGKMGSGSAVIYGIYAAGVGIAGLIFASIKLLKKPNRARSDFQAQDKDAPPAVNGIKDAFKSIFVSMWNGIRLILKNRFLRTLLLMSLIMSLFSDPLVFNILPEFVEGVLSANPGAIGGLMEIPILGWFLDGLMSTPMGFFAMLVTFSSMGSALAMLLLNPLRNLAKKLGFKTEESLTIPFYLLSALAVPAFWLMINSTSFWSVLLLYGLKTFVVSFVGTVIMGIYQKNLGQYTSKQMNQVLAANSFVSIIAAIIATYLYGYVLSDIPIATSLWIAGIATTILGAIRVAAPWLLFSKEQRKKGTPIEVKPERDEEAEDMPTAEDGQLPESNPTVVPEGAAPLSAGL